MKKILCLFFLIISCTPEKNNPIDAPDIFHEGFEKVTEVIIHDIFSPPISSRVYVYVAIAAYEAFIPNQVQYQTLSNQLRGFEQVPRPEEGEEYDFTLASVKAMMTVARTLTFSVDMYDDFEKDTYFRFKNLPTKTYENSMAFGEKIGKHVLAYAKKDNYLQTRGLRYTVKQDENKWRPTPPQFADAMEPYWGTIRTLVLDSAGQFPAPVPPIFSKEKESAFWKEMQGVFETVNKLTEEQKAIAWFWDDNAFVMNVQGHVAFANKKMTPAGHWMAIGRTACRLAKKNSVETLDTYLRIGLTLHEGFIACWHEKYKYEKIRPETAINQLIDSKWVPFLQSPPFPEYTSGHSTISAASAEALSHTIGEDFTFTDSTEYLYGHGVRSFQSFRKAAEESSISRVYGGIHFPSGCEAGLRVGQQMGKYINQKIITKTKK